MLLQCIILIIFTWLVLLKWRKMKFSKLAAQVPAPSKFTALPVIGHALLLAGTDEDRMNTFKRFGREAYNQGGMTSFWLVDRLFIVASDPEIMEVILKNVLDKDDVTKFSRFVIGNGNIFAPETTLGIKINTEMNTEHPFLQAMTAFLEIIGRRMYKPWLHNDFVFELLPIYRKLIHARDVMRTMVDEIIQIKKYPPKPLEKDTLKSFLDLLIESSGGEKGYSDEELREEILVLLIAGTDTSAVAMAFTALMLARHPDVQDNVYQELKEIYGDSDRVLVADDLPRLKYLDAVIRESLRLYPPVPFTSRKVEEDFTLPSGVTLVKGTGVVINMWALHRNPHYWGQDAEQFRPERFLEGPLKHPAQFMPFSHGPRNCIGYRYAMQSMKTALATLCRRYRFVAPPGALKEPRVKFGVMMKDVHNFMTILETRKSSTA